MFYEQLTLDEILRLTEDKLRLIDIGYFKKFPQAQIFTALETLPETHIKTIISVYFGFDRAKVYDESQGHLQIALIENYKSQNKTIPAVFCKYIIENGVADEENTADSLAPYYEGFHVKHKDYKLYPDQYVKLVFRTTSLENQFIRDAAARFKEGKIIPFIGTPVLFQNSKTYDQILSEYVCNLRQKYRFSPAEFNERESIIAIHREFLVLKKNVELNKLYNSINAPVRFNHSVMQYCDHIPLEFIKEYLAYELNEALTNTQQGFCFTEETLTKLMLTIITSKKSSSEKQEVDELVKKIFKDKNAESSNLFNFWLCMYKQFESATSSSTQTIDCILARRFSRKYNRQSDGDNNSAAMTSQTSSANGNADIANNPNASTMSSNNNNTTQSTHTFNSFK